jgi:hypothetical protein
MPQLDRNYMLSGLKLQAVKRYYGGKRAHAKDAKVAKNAKKLSFCVLCPLASFA